MANENLIRFLKGNVANLPETATAGALYFTKDEGIYLGMADGSYHRYGDFITVANVESLPAAGANATCMYYCTAENILARYDSVKGWVQINKQPTAEEMKTLLGLGSLAYLSEVTEANLGTALKEKVNAAAEGNHAHLNKDELDKVADGDVAKWAEAYAHSQVAHAPADAQANVIETVKVNGEALEIKDKAVDITIPESTKVEASTTNGNIKVDGEEVTVYTHPEKHSISEVDGLQDALDGKSNDGHKHVKADITDFAHTHEMSEVNGLADALAAKQDVILEGTYDAYGSAAQALTDAKAYVDEEDKFYNGITTVNALGGIAANTSLDNKTTHEILDMLLFPYVAFSITSSSRSAAAATLENGAEQTLSSCSITVAKKSKPITSITLYNGSTVLETKTGDAVANGGTITFNGFDAITVNKSNNPNLKFTVTDGQTSTDRNVGMSTFVYPYYWGVCSKDAAVDEALIESYTRRVQNKTNNQAVTFDCDNQRMVFAYPKAHGALVSILDPNNFETLGDYTRSEVSITGLDGTAQTYYVYVSGAGTASGFKVQFKLTK